MQFDPFSQQNQGMQQQGLQQQQGLPMQGIPQQQGIPLQQLNQQQGMPQQQSFMPQAGLQYNMPQYNAMQQPQQMSQQQSQFGAQTMPQPPNVISTKDLLYLKDSLSWTLTATKKYNMYAMQCQDPEIKAHFEKIGQIHQRQYNILLSHTQNSNNP